MSSLIWHQYIFLKVALRALAFLAVFYSLYLFIDASIHLKQVTATLGFFSPTLYIYYGFIFSQNLKLFMPLAFLLATTSTLFYLNQHRELLALQAGGIGKKKLALPFLSLAALLMIIMYSNEQWVRPRSVKFIDRIETHYLKAKAAMHKKRMIHSYPVSSDSKVIFARYDGQNQTLTDAFYIKNSATIFHAKKLKLSPGYTTGFSVDQFIQEETGLFKKVESFDTHAFLSLNINPRLIDVKITPVEHVSLSDLASFAFSKQKLPLFPLPQIQTHFFYKLFIPWLLPLTLFFTFPLCTNFSRRMPTLLITAFSLFGFIVFYILQNAFLLMGESGVTPPLLSVLIVPLSSLLILILRRLFTFFLKQPSLL